MVQALAQYLVNLNVWTHNVLTVLARSKAKRSASSCNVCHAGRSLLKVDWAKGAFRQTSCA